jgi:hypothetical protein
LTVDYAGPFNPSGLGGHQYCLFMIDNMTGWLEINTTTSATGRATCTLLEQNFYGYGAPRVIHSDRDPHFDNEDILEWAAKWGIKWVFRGLV